MVQPRKQLSGKTAYWMTFTLKTGERKWRHGGFDKSLAEREENRIRAAIEAGSYVPESSKFVTVEEFFETWLDTRKGRAADNESKSVRDHVLSVEWFAGMRIVDVRPRDCLRVVEEIRTKGLGEKTISNIWSVVNGGFKHAKFEELRTDNPAELPRGTIKRKKVRKRFPYERAEARQLLACADVSWPMQVFACMLFYTGQRKGEGCGRRWRDYDPDSQPLAALLVHSQYDDQPLKGDDEELVRPRVVPVHPELKRKLDWWWAEGFELVYLRKPTLDDFIVPTGRAMVNHTESSAYKAFQTALRKAGVQNRTVHSTRHTFISVARSSGADAKWVEKITHNAAGSTLDDYTDLEWDSICSVMGFVDYSVDRNAKPRFFRAPTQGLEAQTEGGDSHRLPRNGWDRGVENDPQIPSRKPRFGASVDGSQHDDALAFEVALAECMGARPPAKAAPREGAEPIGHRTFLEHDGKRLTVTDWEAETGIPRRTIVARLERGLPVEQALTLPIDERKRAAGAASGAARG